MSGASRTLYLIDGHAQFYRAYHALRPGMTSPVTNEPTNMTFGFMGMVLKVLREYRPTHLAVVIDASGDHGTFRSEIFPEYKANRSPPPDDLQPQIERCLALLRTMNVPIFAHEGVEADDVLASIVTDGLRAALPLDRQRRAVLKTCGASGCALGGGGACGAA